MIFRLASVAQPAPPNEFRNYVDRVKTGSGIWKWNHCHEIYDRHLAKFRGKSANILEISIYSGESLGMRRSYFGPGCKVFGVDIEEECKVYEREGARIFIGDQADHAFWRGFRAEVPELDIVVDDGGDLVHQQAVTLEALLPHLRPGGVYLCKDVHGTSNAFHYYTFGLPRHLNVDDSVTDPDSPDRRVVCTATPFQASVHSIHLYPSVVVIERQEAAVTELVAPKRGTQWQPFGDAWDKRPSETALPSLVARPIGQVQLRCEPTHAATVDVGWSRPAPRASRAVPAGTSLTASEPMREQGSLIPARSRVAPPVALPARGTSRRARLDFCVHGGPHAFRGAAGPGKPNRGMFACPCGSLLPEARLRSAHPSQSAIALQPPTAPWPAKGTAILPAPAPRPAPLRHGRA